MNTLAKLVTTTARDLIDTPLDAVRWLVDGLIATGVTFVCGDPKCGKSFFALQLALCVSSGQPFLDMDVTRCGVLYLCLEDTLARVQQRLFDMCDTAPETLHLTTSAHTLSDGLIIQIGDFINAHSGVKLVVIDTLQMVRTSTRDSAYASDYSDMGALVRYAHENDISIFIIHHTRKYRDGNVFNAVSGTNALMGAADETLILARKDPFSTEATLSITGRDVEAAEHELKFCGSRWEYVRRVTKEELRERAVHPVIFSVLDFVAERAGSWEGTASALVEEAHLEGVASSTITRYLNEHHEFMRDHGVAYGYRRTPSARIISLAKLDPPTSDVAAPSPNTSPKD